MTYHAAARQLRDYQVEKQDEITASLRERRDVLCVMPTASGKTAIMAQRARIAMDGGQRVLTIAHRTELLDQIIHEMQLFGVAAAREQGDEWAPHNSAVVVASVQSIVRRLERHPIDAFDLILIDEAHHAVADTYQTVLRNFPAARRVGFTATPDRCDRKALDMFDDVYEYPITDAIADGWLAQIRQRSIYVHGIDLAKVRVHLGELSSKDLGRVVTAKRSLDGVVAPLLEQTAERKTLVFAVTIEHARLLTQMLNAREQGVARYIASTHTQRYRERALTAFERGRFRVLVNCMLFSEGYNCPDIECVAIARPTMSRSLYSQMIGRGLRPAPGKDHLLVLDFCGNAGRHRLVTVYDAMSLTTDSEDVKLAAAAMAEREGLTVDEALAIARKLPAAELLTYTMKDVDPIGPAYCRHCGVALVAWTRRMRCRGCWAVVDKKISDGIARASRVYVRAVTGEAR